MLSVVFVVTLGLTSGVLGYFSEEKGIYDDSTPYYETHPMSGAYLEDDIEIDLVRNAVTSSRQTWPNGVVPYVIDGNYPDVVKTRIIMAMHEIEYNVNTDGTYDCIHFVPHTNEHNYIYVLPRNSSCSSKVGLAHAGRQEVSIGHGCEHRGIIMHELTHALGFWHEQSRPDRDSYVTIHLNNVASSHRHNYDKHRVSDTLHTTYDYGSIMHYNAYEFALNRNEPAMTPKGHSVPAGVRMGQRLQHSHTDVTKIQRLYGCREDTSHVKQRISSSQDHCDFKSGFCSLHQETSDDFNWATSTHSSTTGPNADGSTGIDNYAVAYASGHSGKHARLTTRTYSYSKICIDWYFFNYGGSGYVKLYFVPSSGYARAVKNYGHQRSKKWYHVYNTLNINGNGQYKLMFEATPHGSDIAIDDINIYEGECI